MNIDFIKGVIVPIVTPVTADEKLDEKALIRIIDFMIEGGISGILAFGSNGEFYMLDDDEMESQLRVILNQVNGRVPVYMGIGAIRTSRCVRLARMGARMGVSGVSVLQPMFIQPSDDELSSHFRSIAESVKELPVILYNNPGRTGYGMSQCLVEALAHTVPNLVGIKDSSGDLVQTMEYVRRNIDIDFRVLCGKDTLIFPGLTVGAVGAISSVANFLPSLVSSIYEMYMNSDYRGALEAQYRLNPIRLQMDQSTFPVATKDYGNLLGLELGKPFLPTKPSPDSQIKSMRELLLAERLL